MEKYYMLLDLINDLHERPLVICTSIRVSPVDPHVPSDNVEIDVEIPKLNLTGTVGFSQFEDVMLTGTESGFHYRDPRSGMELFLDSQHGPNAFDLLNEFEDHHEILRLLEQVVAVGIRAYTNRFRSAPANSRDVALMSELHMLGAPIKYT